MFDKGIVMKMSEKTQRRLRIEQKLDAILSALNYKIESCNNCIDGIRSGGLPPSDHICYECRGSAISVKRYHP